MIARLPKFSLLLRYAAIFWAFYELFMVYVINFQSRIVMWGSTTHFALYALACGAINLVLTLALFRTLDALSSRAAARLAELTALLLIILTTVLVMMSADAMLRVWFDGAPERTFGAYWLFLLRTEFHDSLMTVAFLAGFANALRSWSGEEARQIRESELGTAIARAELEAVAAHLKPAVVSEALREIGAAVESDPARARALTLELANTLRASFRRDRAEARQ